MFLLRPATALRPTAFGFALVLATLLVFQSANAQTTVAQTNPDQTKANASTGKGTQSGKAANADSPAPPTPKKRPAEPRRNSTAEIQPKDKAFDSRCSWTGERVISLLARDDVEGAERFLRFYERFECPAPRIGDAFACVVRSPVAQNTSSAQGMSLADVASACWSDPNRAFPLPATETPENSKDQDQKK